MEGRCSKYCQAISECDCGAFLCRHQIPEHVMQGHSVTPIPLIKALRPYRELLDQIVKYKVQVIQTGDSLVKKVEELTASQMTQLLSLELVIQEIILVPSRASSDYTKQMKDFEAINNSRIKHLNKMSAFIQQLAGKRAIKGTSPKRKESKTPCPKRLWKCQCGAFNSGEFPVCSSCNSLRPGETGWVCKQCIYKNTENSTICGGCYSKNEGFREKSRPKMLDLSSSYRDLILAKTPTAQTTSSKPSAVHGELPRYQGLMTPRVRRNTEIIPPKSDSLRDLGLTQRKKNANSSALKCISQRSTLNKSYYFE